MVRRRQEGPDKSTLDTHSGFLREMAPVLVKCLEADPERRYTNARELANDLRTVSPSRGTTTAEAFEEQLGSPFTPHCAGRSPGHGTRSQSTNCDLQFRLQSRPHHAALSRFLFAVLERADDHQRDRFPDRHRDRVHLCVACRTICHESSGDGENCHSHDCDITPCELATILPFLPLLNGHSPAWPIPWPCIWAECSSRWPTTSISSARCFCADSSQRAYPFFFATAFSVARPLPGLC